MSLDCPKIVSEFAPGALGEWQFLSGIPQPIIEQGISKYTVNTLLVSELKESNCRFVIPLYRRRLISKAPRRLANAAL